jgi:hypothetical protein
VPCWFWHSLFGSQLAQPWPLHLGGPSLLVLLLIFFCIILSQINTLFPVLMLQEMAEARREQTTVEGES